MVKLLVTHLYQKRGLGVVYFLEREKLRESVCMRVGWVSEGEGEREPQAESEPRVGLDPTTQRS